MIRCQFVPGRGRFVVAATYIPAGGLIFREEAYCVVQRIGDAKHPRCVNCCADAKQPFSTCKDCGSAFCCEECVSSHSTAHVTNGECCAVIATKLAQSFVPPEDMDTFEMACLTLGRCTAEGKTSRLSHTPAELENGTFETVGFGVEEASPLRFLNTTATPETVFLPTYDHVECLCTNLHDTDPEIVEDFAKLHDVYQSILQKKKFIQRVRNVQHRLPTNVSRETFVAICTSFLCNGFGLWSPVNRQLGVASYPQSSYFNHSCAPNMGRRNLAKTRVIEFFAAKPIEEGEPLCISYVDLKLPAAERKAKLKATYSFDCMCVRCISTADFVTANTVCCDCVPALCGSCISKVMQPLGNEMYVCPCCNEVQQAS